VGLSVIAGGVALVASGSNENVAFTSGFSVCIRVPRPLGWWSRARGVTNQSEARPGRLAL
jgi:hypothetical protein